MKKNIEQFIKILIYSSFFIPLVIVPNSFIFPFIVPKVLLLRSIIFLMIGAYIALLLINWKYYKPKFTLLNVLLGLFLISFVISTFVGSDPYHSFWDNHERMLGLFTITHYIAYYFVASAVFKSWKEWKWALRIFLIAGSGVMMIAALQAVNPDFLLNQGSDRSASTLGNAIYVGGYGLFLVFVAVLLLLKEEVTSWRYVEIVLGILALLGLFFSGTRGSLIGLLVGVVVAIVCYSFILKDFPRLRKVLWGCIILGVVATGVLYLNRQTTFVKGIPAVGRILNTSLQDISHSPRSIAWSIGVESWKEKPIFGWGPNNFFYAFNKYYHPESLEFGYPETWFDNAHNILVNTLTVQGLFGLVVYLGIFIGAI
jgi:O-antigen ligase